MRSKEKEIETRRCTQQGGHFSDNESRQHVRVRKGLMATHAHNVRLTWVVEVFDRIKDSKFLAFGPMRMVFT